MSSIFVRRHMVSSCCIESTSSCKKSINLPSGLAALVSVCIEPRRRSISRPASSRSLRRPASHSWQPGMRHARKLCLPSSVTYGGLQCMPSSRTDISLLQPYVVGLLNQNLSDFRIMVHYKITDTYHKIIISDLCVAIKAYGEAEVQLH